MDTAVYIGRNFRSGAINCSAHNYGTSLHLQPGLSHATSVLNTRSRNSLVCFL